jgi:hypothetical protein
MAMVLTGLAAICGLGSLVCFVLVVIMMFQHGDSTLGIVSLVLLFCFGIGGIVAFIVGWMKAGVYEIQTLMLIWTGCIAGSLIFRLLAGMLAGPSFEL